MLRRISKRPSRKEPSKTEPNLATKLLALPAEPISRRERRNPLSSLEALPPSKCLRILDFDCEARPLHWIGGDYVSKEVTAIACKFIGESGSAVWALGEVETEEMLEGFREWFDAADMVTGHYIRGYDLPTLNGAMSEFGLAPLGDKLAHDTKIDLMKRSGLSGSQENLGTMLGLQHPKVKMDQAKWREANRLTKAGIALTKERVLGDVHQHIEMRQRLIELGYLAEPKLWRCRAAVTPGGYRA